MKSLVHLLTTNEKKHQCYDVLNYISNIDAEPKDKSESFGRVQSKEININFLCVTV